MSSQGIRMFQTVTVKLENKLYKVEVGDLTERPVKAVVDGYAVEVDLSEAVTDQTRQEESGRRSPVTRSLGAASPVRPPARAAAPRTPVDSRPVGAVVSSAPNPNKVFSAPMPGTILSIAVSPGDQVVTGDTICVLEAMKMQQVLRADWSGVIKAVLVAAGQQVMDGAPIVELE